MRVHSQRPTEIKKLLFKDHNRKLNQEKMATNISSIANENMFIIKQSSNLLFLNY